MSYVFLVVRKIIIEIYKLTINVKNAIYSVNIASIKYIYKLFIIIINIFIIFKINKIMLFYKNYTFYYL
jgi:hypothetical protein